jgi:endonuclease/exonuclease/phosphatase family metal-dependent hydrolase
MSKTTALLVVIATLLSTTAAAATELRVMSFNIEWGGDNISFAKVVEAVQVSNADIVGIQEPVGNLQRLATELGWYFDEQSYVISRFPVLAAPGAGGKYVFVEVEAGKYVAIANIHLPSDPDGIAMVRDGASASEVIALERKVRLPKIVPFLQVLKPLIDRNIPVFLTGDFNAPSHTDWTADTVGERPFLRYPLQWPVSVAVSQTGLKDSYREVYPDPQQHPGLTWWARRPPLPAYTPDENDAEERIDFLWYAGAVEVESTEIVGERGFAGVSISVEPWPSDHRGVLSSFTVTPAPLPALVTTRHRVNHAADEIELLYRRADHSNIQIQRVGADHKAAPILQRQVSGDGQFTIAADRLSPGHYAVSMTQQNAAELHSEFWVQDAAATPQVSVSGKRFEAGESIAVAWQNGPGFRNDYLSIALQSSEADYDGGSAWLYVDALPDGEITLDSNSVEFGWPIAPGDYVLRLMKDDGAEVLAESSVFTVH